MIFAVDGRVQSHDIFHSLRDVMQESGDAANLLI